MQMGTRELFANEGISTTLIHVKSINPVVNTRREALIDRLPWGAETSATPLDCALAHRESGKPFNEPTAS